MMKATQVWFSCNNTYFISDSLKMVFMGIMHHLACEGGEGGGGTSCNPSKDFKKLNHKNAQKTSKNRIKK